MRLPPEHNRAGKGVDQQCSSGGRRIGRRRHCARALEEGEHVYVDLERGGGGGDEAQDGLEGVEGAGELGQIRLGADGDGARVSGGGGGGSASSAIRGEAGWSGARHLLKQPQ